MRPNPKFVAVANKLASSRESGPKLKRPKVKKKKKEV